MKWDKKNKKQLCKHTAIYKQKISIVLRIFNIIDCTIYFKEQKKRISKKYKGSMYKEKEDKKKE